MAIAYINKFGSVQHPHLTDIAREIWKWYKERNVLFASYITSVDNVIADSEYRVLRHRMVPVEGPKHSVKSKCHLVLLTLTSSYL